MSSGVFVVMAGVQDHQRAKKDQANQEVRTDLVIRAFLQGFSGKPRGTPKHAQNHSTIKSLAVLTAVDSLGFIDHLIDIAIWEPVTLL